MPVFEIYIDESCKDNHHYLTLGGIIVEQPDINDILAEFTPLRNLQGCDSELKWVKTDSYNLDGYRQIVNKFFELNQRDAFTFTA